MRIINIPCIKPVSVADKHVRLIEELARLAHWKPDSVGTKISLIKFMREEYSLDLKEAKGLVDVIWEPFI